MVFQNPYASLNPRKTVAALLEEPLAINGVSSRPARREAGLAMLAKVGLRHEHYRRYPHMFSGVSAAAYRRRACVDAASTTGRRR
jgi:dipeptide transport system ATP-binding protein